MRFAREQLCPWTVLGLYLCSRPTLSAPIKARDLDPTTFANLQLFSQFSAAAYCPSNNDKGDTATKIACPGSNNCPLVENDDVQSVLEFQNSLFTDVTGYVAVDNTRQLVILAFRGSHSLQNWLADIDIQIVQTDICDDCTATQGFYGSWLEARSGVIQAVTSALTSNPSYQLIVTGHSLGGAIADIAAAEFRNSPPISGLTVDLYTYGAPRISNSNLVNYLEQQSSQGKGNNYRVTHKNDPVPRLPLTQMGFADLEPQYFINAGDGVPVTEMVVSQVTGARDGDGGDPGFPPYDINAHLWYFGRISACDQ